MDKRLKMPDHVLQCILKWQILDGDVANNVLYLHRADCTPASNDVAWDDGFADSQAHNLATAFKNHMASFISSTCSLVQVDWTWNESTTVPGPLHEGTAGGGDMPWAGTNAGAPSDSAVSLAIRLQTGLGGRSNHGRFFMVGINAGLYDVGAPNHLKASSVTDFATALPLLLAAVNNNTCVMEVGDDVHWSVVSFYLPGSHGATLRPVALHKYVTAVNLSDINFDFQRRRAPAHARHF